MIAISKKEQKNKQWLNVLKQALDDGELIRPNFRYTYKGKNLGAFLYKVKKSKDKELKAQVAEIGFDFEEAKKNSIRNQKHQQWLQLLEEAIEEGVEIKVNHRFKYKGKNLGTFLVGAKHNKQLVKKIKKIGVDYKDFVRKKPHLYANKFLKDLQKADASQKGKFITRFYRFMLPLKDKINPKTIEKINKEWKLTFNDRRIWRRPLSEEQRVSLWKNWRYDEEKNPEGKWLLSARRMGNLFTFAYHRKRKPYLMIRIDKYFTDVELEELKSEGFFDEKYITHNIT